MPAYVTDRPHFLKAPNVGGTRWSFLILTLSNCHNRLISLVPAHTSISMAPMKAESAPISIMLFWSPNRLLPRWIMRRLESTGSLCYDSLSQRKMLRKASVLLTQVRGPIIHKLRKTFANGIMIGTTTLRAATSIRIIRQCGWHLHRISVFFFFLLHRHADHTRLSQ